MSNLYCHSQNKKNMQKPNNTLQCDTETGVCEMPTNQITKVSNGLQKANKKPVKIIYFTDPICSSCWGIEPQLRKLKLEYGNLIEIEYKMGGLLPDWSYNSGGISKPLDVAQHWDEVSLYYDMPIDGDLWVEDPLASSYPPSIACKAAQMQDNEKAIIFLREIKEMVFLQKKNITKWVYLELAAKKAGLDIQKFKTDYNGKAIELFEKDLKLSKALGVRGFPTLFFTNTKGDKEMVYGAKPYKTFENALLKLFATATKTKYDKSWTAVFSTYPSLTAKEFSELTETDRKESEAFLNNLTLNGMLEKTSTKNGSIWTIKKTAFNNK